MGKWVKISLFFLLITLSFSLFGDLKSIKGKEAIWKEKENLVLFKGNVEVIDSDFSLKGEEIKVKMKNGKFLEMSGENGIEIVKGKEKIQADTFIFHPEGKIVSIGGNVKVKKKKIILESESGTFNIESGIIFLKGNVKASFK